MNYFLAEACRNTFVMFDQLNAAEIKEEFLQHVHRCLLEENRDDALIIYAGESKGHSFYARMMVLGADGQIAEFCGNGSRAVAAYLFEHIKGFREYFLIDPSNIHRLSMHGNGIYSVKLQPPDFTLKNKFIADLDLLKSFESFTYVNVLEPHLVFLREVSDEELTTIGRELNQRKDIFPYGINVNAWTELKKDHIFVKTYERGVQRLTKSCGTGSISCAALYKAQGNVLVTTPGGLLEIALQTDGVELKGPAFFFCNSKKERAG